MSFKPACRPKNVASAHETRAFMAYSCACFIYPKASAVHPECFVKRNGLRDGPRGPRRSEEHTSELQSLMRISYAVFCLKKTKQYNSLHSDTIETERTTQEY